MLMSAAKIEAINEDHARRIRDACIKVIEQESKPKPKPQAVQVKEKTPCLAIVPKKYRPQWNRI